MRATFGPFSISCLSLVSLLVELLDKRAAPLLQPCATTAARVSCCGVLVWSLLALCGFVQAVRQGFRPLRLACLSLVSLLVELLDERAPPPLQAIATTAAWVSTACV